MLIGFLSDPHGNLPALQAVLEDVRSVAPDVLVCLGDLVGYGPFPNETVDCAASEADLVLVGNHDLAVTGALDAGTYNTQARRAIEWTLNNVSDGTMQMLKSLKPTGEVHGILVAHASPRHPAEEYVLSVAVAEANMGEVPFDRAFVGHTHVPMVFASINQEVVALTPVANEPMVLGSLRAILNPGSVGQPRDGDPRASWGTWESETGTFTLRRVYYPIATTQEAILAAGLPDALAWRLEVGR